MVLQNIRSNTASKRPLASGLSDGQIAVNTNETSPGLFFKGASGAVLKVGPVHVGNSAPNSSPATGGSTGNSVGEQWLDTSNTKFVFKIWDGTDWRSETGEFVDVTGDTMTGNLTISGADLVMSNGEIIAASGAEATPSITFDGDLDTGFYKPAADKLAISTGGTSRVIIDDSGKVGIGTTNPSNSLHVFNSTADVVLKVESGDSISRIELKDNASSNYISTVGGNLDFATNGVTSNMRIDSDGLVGIGTTAPTDGKLEIFDTSYQIALKTSGVTGNLGIGMFANGAFIGTRGNNGGTEDNLRFGTSATEKARIDSDGRLLVGTSSTPPAIETLTPGLVRSGFGALQDDYTAGIYCYRNAGGSGRQTIAPRLFFARSRSGINNSTGGVVNANDNVGNIRFAADDGTNFITAAEILVQVDGTPGANDMPGRLVLATTGDGASSPTEHFRIASDGTLTATDTTIGSNSDGRLKTNVADFVYSLEDFKQYQPKTFDWKNPGLHGNQTGQRGFIAQDVENIDGYWVGEQAVQEDSEDAKFLNEDLLAKTLKLGKKDAMYVSVIQQLLAKIETLEQRLTDAGIA